jgi:hypothetical protein
MSLNHEDMQQISHVARLAVLALCARGVAASEFENPEIQSVQVVVFRPEPGAVELPAELVIFGASDVPMGGVNL